MTHHTRAYLITCCKINLLSVHCSEICGHMCASRILWKRSMLLPNTLNKNPSNLDIIWRWHRKWYATQWRVVYQIISTFMRAKETDAINSSLKELTSIVWLGCSKLLLLNNVPSSEYFHKNCVINIMRGLVGLWKKAILENTGKNQEGREAGWRLVSTTMIFWKWVHKPRSICNNWNWTNVTWIQGR